MTETLSQRIVLDLLSFVWPSMCLGCGRPDRDWCHDCRETFDASHRVIDVIPRVTEPRVWLASGAYEGMRKTLISRLKHEGQMGVARHLGLALHGPLSVMVGSIRDPLIVLMPSRPARVRQRGYRHLELVMRHAGIVGWQEGRRVLEPTTHRTGQVGLDERARARNAARIRVSGRAQVAGRNLVLVDDIVTTGATLAAADRVLTDAGANVVGACVIAATLRKDDTLFTNSSSQLALPNDNR